VSKTDVSGVF